MATVFPTSLDTFTTKVNGVDDVLAADTNNLQDAVAALQAKVGTNGSANSSTIDFKVASLLADIVKLIGVGQTWQNVLASRVQDTAYQNTTGKPIQVAIGADAQDGPRSFQVSSNGSTWVLVGRFAENAGLRENNVFAIIPPGWYYKVVGPASITHWAELR